MESCMADMKTLNRRLATLLLAALTGYAWAQEPGQSGYPVVKTELHRVEATVKTIDYDTRHVTVVGNEGPVSFVVGPEARNVATVRVGDKVIVSYYQGLAAEMSKEGRHVKEPSAAA